MNWKFVALVIRKQETVEYFTQKKEIDRQVILPETLTTPDSYYKFLEIELVTQPSCRE